MKIAVVDDHALFRDGLSHVIARLDGAVEILHAGRGEEALTLADRHADLDLMLVDLDMPGLDGWQALDRLVAHHPTVPVVILSASQSPADGRRALQVGAMGFIPKSATTPVMLGALQLVLAGGIYLPPELALGEQNPGPDELTPRQRQVLDLLKDGRSNKQIADRLQLSEATVKMHVTAIIRALGVRNRTQAVLKALDNGLNPR